ncbi:hypothetical protein CROQUDRAFT_136415 [Cronartium quercuum f. sp. fusiforme G11]|uniref:Uncharacterized protein n=1 Tax=Cronartium quercuum f. sp. fusiforme G11 TaxID=708437 RepID=A0A9P6N6Y5_9BASI|nr:hypothetical protein CROQUDRAFT_136415 [Cronartium quercuum f. sp. fusiforme G11]
MLFNKAFILPVAIIASSVFTSAQKTSVDHKPGPYDLLNAFAILENAEAYLIEDYKNLSIILKASKPKTAKVHQELADIAKAIKQMHHDFTNAPGVGEAKLMETSRETATVIGCSKAFGHIINLLVASVSAVQNSGIVDKKTKIDFRYMSNATLSTLEVTTDKLKVTERDYVKKNIDDFPGLFKVPYGFSAIASYLNSSSHHRF